MAHPETHNYRCTMRGRRGHNERTCTDNDMEIGEARVPAMPVPRCLHGNLWNACASCGTTINNLPLTT